MKKIIIFSTALLIAILATIFFACKKDNKEEQNSPPLLPTEYSEYGINIDELIQKTGIDIYKLSKLPTLQEISFDISKCVEKTNAKVELTDALYAQIQQLRTAVETAAANGNDVAFLTSFEQLCTLTKSINGIKFVSNGDGYTTITYNDNGSILEYNFPNLKAHVTEGQEILRGVVEEYPEFLNLPENTRIEILTAAVYLNYLEKEGIEDPLLAPQSCAGAKAELAIRLTSYTLAYTVTAGLCCGTTFAVLVCEGLAFAAYIDSSTSAIKSYNKAMKTCK